MSKELIERLERVYDNLTPGAIERADLDGMAFDVRDAIQALSHLPDREEVEAIALSVPDDLDLYRILRAAGRKDADKAKAVRAVLEPIERRILSLMERKA